MRKKRVSKKEQQRKIKMMFAVSILIVLILIVFVMIYSIINKRGGANAAVTVAKTDSISVVEEFLDPNEYSRPQTPLTVVYGVVVHYTANPGTDADANRNYFNGLEAANEGKPNPVYASSHYIIGLDGTIVQCIPLNEISYASNNRNNDTISIECCHPDKTGKFTAKTYDSLVSLTAWLCGEYNIQSDGIIRHYDITGKMCPKYYVKHEKKWIKFKNDVFDYIGKFHL